MLVECLQSWSGSYGGEKNSFQESNYVHPLRTLLAGLFQLIRKKFSNDRRGTVSLTASCELKHIVRICSCRVIFAFLQLKKVMFCRMGNGRMSVSGWR